MKKTKMYCSEHGALKMDKTAIIDETGQYRYLLTRIWDKNIPPAVFIMLNPSTADADQDDPTIRRCIDFAHRWGYGGLKVVNVFAYRATVSGELKEVADPVGPKNYEYIRGAIADAGIVVAAWGASGPKGRPEYDKTLRVVYDALVECHHLGLSASGQPRHPLYLPKTTVPEKMDWEDKVNE